METPKYDHWGDDLCRFLGRYVGLQYGVEYDLYWCWNSGEPTIVARHGDFPQDCACGLRCAQYHEGLQEAVKRAKKRNLAVTK